MPLHGPVAAWAPPSKSTSYDSHSQERMSYSRLTAGWEGVRMLLGSFWIYWQGHFTCSWPPYDLNLNCFKLFFYFYRSLWECKTCLAWAKAHQLGPMTIHNQQYNRDVWTGKNTILETKMWCGLHEKRVSNQQHVHSPIFGIEPPPPYRAPYYLLYGPSNQLLREGILKFNNWERES